MEENYFEKAKKLYEEKDVNEASTKDVKDEAPKKEHDFPEHPGDNLNKETKQPERPRTTVVGEENDNQIPHPGMPGQGGFAQHQAIPPGFDVAVWSAQARAFVQKRISTIMILISLFSIYTIFTVSTNLVLTDAEALDRIKNTSLETTQENIDLIKNAHLFTGIASLLAAAVLFISNFVIRSDLKKGLKFAGTAAWVTLGVSVLSASIFHVILILLIALNISKTRKFMLRIEAQRKMFEQAQAQTQTQE